VITDDPHTWSVSIAQATQEGFATTASLLLLLLGSLAVAMIVTILYLAIRRTRHHPRHHA
jgi:hypothetical protein